MGIFTRFRDIVSANINAMLDRAEDPEKLVKLMIREMEDTLVELKASCAGVMAGRKKMDRQKAQLREQETLWAQRAELAVDKGRDDLAREALQEKRRYGPMLATLQQAIAEHTSMIEQYQDDIRQLEDKLVKAREKQRMLVQRHIRARQKKQAQTEMRRMDSYATIAKFDDLEHRIERMEAEADLVNYGRKTTLDETFDNLRYDEDIENELAAIKASRSDRQDAAGHQADSDPRR